MDFRSLVVSCAFEGGRCGAVRRAADGAVEVSLIPSADDDGAREPRVWYFFSVSGGVAGRTLRLRVTDMSPLAKLLSSDLRPLVRVGAAGGDAAPPVRVGRGGWERLREPGASFAIHQPLGAASALEVSFQYTFPAGAAGAGGAAPPVFFAFHFPFGASDCARLVDMHKRFAVAAAGATGATGGGGGGGGGGQKAPPSPPFGGGGPRGGARRATREDARGEEVGDGVPRRLALAPPATGVGAAAAVLSLAATSAASFARERPSSAHAAGGKAPAAAPSLHLSASSPRASSIDGGPMPTRGIYFARQLIATTADGRRVELITISSTSGMGSGTSSASSSTAAAAGALFRGSGKRTVYVTARCHPGAAASSYAVHGLIALLMQPAHAAAAALRKAFVFKIVPMANPDGVARGHWQTDQFGVDFGLELFGSGSVGVVGGAGVGSGSSAAGRPVSPSPVSPFAASQRQHARARGSSSSGRGGSTAAAPPPPSSAVVLNAIRQSMAAEAAEALLTAATGTPQVGTAPPTGVAESAVEGSRSDGAGADLPGPEPFLHLDMDAAVGGGSSTRGIRLALLSLQQGGEGPSASLPAPAAHAARALAMAISMQMHAPQSCAFQGDEFSGRSIGEVGAVGGSSLPSSSFEASAAPHAASTEAVRLLARDFLASAAVGSSHVSPPQTPSTFSAASAPPALSSPTARSASRNLAGEAPLAPPTSAAAQKPAMQLLQLPAGIAGVDGSLSGRMSGNGTGFAPSAASTLRILHAPASSTSSTTASTASNIALVRGRSQPSGKSGIGLSFSSAGADASLLSSSPPQQHPFLAVEGSSFVMDMPSSSSSIFLNYGDALVSTAAASHSSATAAAFNATASPSTAHTLRVGSGKSSSGSSGRGRHFDVVLLPSASTLLFTAAAPSESRAAATSSAPWPFADGGDATLGKSRASLSPSPSPARSSAAWVGEGLLRERGRSSEERGATKAPPPPLASPKPIPGAKARLPGAASSPALPQKHEHSSAHAPPIYDDASLVSGLFSLCLDSARPSSSHPWELVAGNTSAAASFASSKSLPGLCVSASPVTRTRLVLDPSVLYTVPCAEGSFSGPAEAPLHGSDAAKLLLWWKALGGVKSARGSSSASAATMSSGPAAAASGYLQLRMDLGFSLFPHAAALHHQQSLRAAAQKSGDEGVDASGAAALAHFLPFVRAFDALASPTGKDGAAATAKRASAHESAASLKSPTSRMCVLLCDAHAASPTAHAVAILPLQSSPQFAPHAPFPGAARSVSPVRPQTSSAGASRLAPGRSAAVATAAQMSHVVSPSSVSAVALRPTKSAHSVFAAGDLSSFVLSSSPILPPAATPAPVQVPASAARPSATSLRNAFQDAPHATASYGLDGLMQVYGGFTCQVDSIFPPLLAPVDALEGGVVSAAAGSSPFQSPSPAWLVCSSSGSGASWGACAHDEPAAYASGGRAFGLTLLDLLDASAPPGAPAALRGSSECESSVWGSASSLYRWAAEATAISSPPSLPPPPPPPPVHRTSASPAPGFSLGEMARRTLALSSTVYPLPDPSSSSVGEVLHRNIAIAAMAAARPAARALSISEGATGGGGPARSRSPVSSAAALSRSPHRNASSLQQLSTAAAVEGHALPTSSLHHLPASPAPLTGLGEAAISAAVRGSSPPPFVAGGARTLTAEAAPLSIGGPAAGSAAMSTEGKGGGGTILSSIASSTAFFPRTPTLSAGGRKAPSSASAGRSIGGSSLSAEPAALLLEGGLGGGLSGKGLLQSLNRLDRSSEGGGEDPQNASRSQAVGNPRPRTAAASSASATTNGPPSQGGGGGVRRSSAAAVAPLRSAGAGAPSVTSALEFAAKVVAIAAAAGGGSDHASALSSERSGLPLDSIAGSSTTSASPRRSLSSHAPSTEREAPAAAAGPSSSSDAPSFTTGEASLPRLGSSSGRRSPPMVLLQLPPHIDGPPPHVPPPSRGSIGGGGWGMSPPLSPSSSRPTSGRRPQSGRPDSRSSFTGRSASGGGASSMLQQQHVMVVSVAELVGGAGQGAGPQRMGTSTMELPRSAQTVAVEIIHGAL